MMTQQLHVSILAAPVSAIDPRALSQAWYSALRLARDSSQLPFSTCALPEEPCAIAPSVLHRAYRRAEANVAGAVAISRLAKRCGGVLSDASARRTVARPSLARRIERAFAGARAPQRRATFSFGQGSARVHVILQTSGTRSMLVALCRPELQPFVSRALAQAGRALATRGIAGDLRVRTIGRCF
jgi:hypothetical protein